MLIMLVGAALALDAMPCPPIQPRPQSCSVDAPQTISLLAAEPPWRIAANLYTRKMISDDPALFHKYGLPWMGATWSIPENAKLWADAVRTSRARYGAQSTAKGLLCTNWGGGRIERNVPIVAELSWNLYQ